LLGGMLAHWVCGVDPQLCLVTDRRRPWFPATFGMLGGGLSTTRCSQRAREIAADKHLSGSLLRASGFRLPESASFSSDARKSALRYAKSIGGAAVVKPLRSGQSRGVTMGIRSTSDFHAAMQGLELAGFGEEDFLVEEEIVGRNYRFVASQDRLLSVLERSPLSVIGDGRSSIRRLVAGIDALNRPGFHRGSVVCVSACSAEWG
jgi:D-alanine-D-alanine ligase-like ATP-grasp enzyme